MTSINQKFEQYKGIAYKLAIAFSKKHYSIPYVDLRQEALYALTKYLHGGIGTAYDESLSSEATWIYKCVYFYLKNYVIKYQKEMTYSYTGEGTPKPQVMTYSYSEEGTPEAQARENWLDKFIREISEEARALVKIITQAPAEIAKDVTTSTAARGRTAVKSYLIDEKDWSEHKFITAWEEVKSCLSE